MYEVQEIHLSSRRVSEAGKESNEQLIDMTYPLPC